MHRLVSVCAVVLFAFSVSACESMKGGLGALLGGAGGAAIGSQFGGGTGQIVATAIGTLAGAWMGSEIGKSLDRADRLASQKATQIALNSVADSGSVPDSLKGSYSNTMTWRNPDTGNSGTVTPTKSYLVGSRHCREFAQTILVEGREERGYGRACRERDGTWKIVN